MSQFLIASFFKISRHSHLLVPTFRRLSGGSNYHYIAIQDKSGVITDFKLANMEAFSPVYPLDILGDASFQTVYEAGSYGILVVEVQQGIVEVIDWRNVETRWQEGLGASVPAFSSYLIRKLFDNNALAKTPKLGASIKGWRSAEYIGQRTLDKVWSNVSSPVEAPPRPASESTILATYADKYAMLRHLHDLNTLEELDESSLREWRILFSYLWRIRYDVETMLSLASSQITKQPIHSPLFQYIFRSVTGFLEHPNFKDAISYILDEIEDSEHDDAFSTATPKSKNLQLAASGMQTHANRLNVLLSILDSQLEVRTSSDKKIDSILNYLFCKFNVLEKEDRQIELHSTDYIVSKIIDYVPLVERDTILWKSTIERVFQAIEIAEFGSEKRAFLLRLLRQSISPSAIRSLMLNSAAERQRKRLERILQRAIDAYQV